MTDGKRIMETMLTHSACHYTSSSALSIFFYSFPVDTHFPDTNKLTLKKTIWSHLYWKENQRKHFQVARTDQNVYSEEKLEKLGTAC